MKMIIKSVTFVIFIISGIIIFGFSLFSKWCCTKYCMASNLVVLLVMAVLCTSCSMNKMIARETQEILDASKPIDNKIISEDAIDGLPTPVQKWIKNTGMIGKPWINSAYIKQKALMKMKPEQKDWNTAYAEQYTTINTPAFIWTVKMSMSPIINIRGRDKFVDGRGEMLIRMNSLINVVNDRGFQIDEGSIQRYLGELVWCPSLALSPYITWESIDESSAKATMNYKGTSGSGTFYFNDKGEFVKFVAFRYMGNKKDAKRYPWVLTVDDYAVFEGIKVPSKMKATWELDEEDWTWLDLEVLHIEYNGVKLDFH